MQRIIPGRDRGDHADRFAHDQRIADLFLPVELVDNPRHGSEHPGRQAGLDQPGDMDRHTHLARDQGGDLVAALGKLGMDG